MTNRTSPLLPSSEDSTVNEKLKTPEKSGVDRRAFLRNSMVAGAAVTVGAGILGDSPSAFGQQDGKKNIQRRRRHSAFPGCRGNHRE
jgi:hypothetical protein